MSEREEKRRLRGARSQKRARVPVTEEIRVISYDRVVAGAINYFVIVMISFSEIMEASS
jgi:hypothetical protein